MSKLILGMAQLGMDYKPYKQKGRPAFDNAYEILKSAYQLGVEEFDTAAENEYGLANKLLESFQNKMRVKLKINLKIKTLPAYYDYIEGQYVDVYRKLGKLNTVMIHDDEDIQLYHGSTAWKIKENGYADKFGISFYDVEKAVKAIELPFIDVVQVPYSLVDQRADRLGLFDKAKKLGKEVQVRAIFYQGRLLDNKSSTLNRFMRYSWFRRLNCPLIHIAFGFVFKTCMNSSIVVGCETVEQLVGITTARDRFIMPDPEKLYQDFASIKNLKTLFIDDPEYYETRGWRYGIKRV